MCGYENKQTPKFQWVSHHGPFVLPTGMMAQTVRLIEKRLLLSTITFLSNQTCYFSRGMIKQVGEKKQLKEELEPDVKI